MSDIPIFNENGIFLIGLTLIAPLGLLLLIGWLLRAMGKPKAAKVFFLTGLGYVLLVILLFLILVSSK